VAKGKNKYQEQQQTDLGAAFCILYKKPGAGKIRVYQYRKTGVDNQNNVGFENSGNGTRNSPPRNK